MNFQDLLNDNSLIDSITDKELLKQIYKEGDELYSPIANTLSNLHKKIREIEHLEYLNSRDIKHYPILNTILNNLGEKYKDALITLDEYINNCKNGNKWFNSHKLYVILKDRKLYKDDMLENIINVLLDNNLISKRYNLNCNRCNDTIIMFDKYPSQEELDAAIENNWICDNCMEEVTNNFDNIIQSGFYNII